jgi:hypothetical protein
MIALPGDTPLRAILEGWGDFYLIGGTAAAALTGLQFVVQTLIASEAPREPVPVDPEAGIAAFGSPTVVHFAMALLISGLLTTPWPAYGGLRVSLGMLGVGGLAYVGVVLRRTRRQRVYVPVAEDWIWHLLLPSVAYASVLVAAVLPAHSMEGALLTVAAVTMLLLCIGIHNAWDTVVHLTLRLVRAGPSAGPERGGSERGASPKDVEGSEP